MQLEEVKLLNGEFTLNASAPTTVEEAAAALGGSVENVVEEAVSNVRYRNWYPRVYGKASEAITKDGFPKEQAVDKNGTPLVKAKKDGTETKVMESDMDHLRRFVDGGEENKEILGGILSGLCESEPLFVQGERVGGGGKIAANILEEAKKRIAAGDEVVDKTVAAVEATVPGYKVGRTPEGAVTEESLARGIAAYTKYKLDEAKKGALAGLGA